MITEKQLEQANELKKTIRRLRNHLDKSNHFESYCLDREITEVMESVFSTLCLQKLKKCDKELSALIGNGNEDAVQGSADE